jgi:hypothetical protein
MSVIASGLFGTISGSAVANVVVDGWLSACNANPINPILKSLEAT